MTTIATLGPSVRLIVFQFLMKSAQVPTIVPPKRESEAPPLPPVSGMEVLESTPRVNLIPLMGSMAFGNGYEIVDTWKKSHEKNWQMSFVRFVFCRKERVKPEGLCPDFIARKKELEDFFVSLVANNIWATQAHLNPYFEKDGTPTDHKVLMFGCVGRVPNDWVFSGGRDKDNRGVGPKVQLSTLSSCLEINGDKIILAAPELIPTSV